MTKQAEVRSDSVADLASGVKEVKLFTDELGSTAGHTYEFGCPALDISYGGIKSGKIYEIFGWESQGKSTIALEISKAFSNYWNAKGDDNYAIVWIETESAMDKVRATWMGCPVKKFIVCEAETIEEAENLIIKMLEKAKLKKMRLLFVWDTIAASTTMSEKNPKINPDGTANAWSGGMMEKPRIIRAMFRRITTPLGMTDSTLILVNQIYSGVGNFASDDSPGGGGIKFHCSVRTKIKKTGDIIETLPNGQQQKIGITSLLEHVKNKITVRQACEIVIKGETGLDIIETNLNYLTKTKQIAIAGGWKKFQFPEGYATKKEDGTFERAKMVEYSYQAAKKVKDDIEVKYPQMKEWMDYLIYKDFTASSPLVKVKIIKKVWHYEEKFFGSKQTILTDKELEVAKIIYDDLNRQEMVNALGEITLDDSQEEK